MADKDMKKVKDFLIKNQKGIEAMQAVVEKYESHNPEDGEIRWGDLLGHCINNHKSIENFEEE